MTTQHDPWVHHYISTACLHGLCDQRCRSSCKFCGAMCSHGCHPQDGSQASPPPWTDQARDIAARLLAAAQKARGGLHELDRDLFQQVVHDPNLFWLRGEVQPSGTWTPTEGEAG